MASKNNAEFVVKNKELAKSYLNIRDGKINNITDRYQTKIEDHIHLSKLRKNDILNSKLRGIMKFDISRLKQVFAKVLVKAIQDHNYTIRPYFALIKMYQTLQTISFRLTYQKHRNKIHGERIRSALFIQQQFKKYCETIPNDKLGKVVYETKCLTDIFIIINYKRIQSNAKKVFLQIFQEVNQTLRRKTKLLTYVLNMKTIQKSWRSHMLIKNDILEKFQT